MSATNRGAERKPNDFYATPIDCIENFLSNYGGIKGDILEPSAGSGNIIQALRNKNIEGYITALEIRSEEESVLKEISDQVVISDFLNWNTDKKFDVIIGNPPFTYAKEFIEKSLELLNDKGKLIFLLRTSFLESRTRYEFWQKNPPGSLYVLSKRPSFINGKTDACSYSWFIWDKSDDNQYIKII